MEQKHEIRERLLAQREERTPCDPEMGRRLLARLGGLACLSRANVLAAYMAMPGEVDVSPLLRSWRAGGGELWLPRYDVAIGSYRMTEIDDPARDVVRGRYGIPEPKAERGWVDARRQRAADVVWLIPGVAFDTRGHRLGRGKGYYDRLLAGVEGTRIGVAWDWQILEKVPVTTTDEPVDWIVTEERGIACVEVDSAQAART